MHKTVFMFSGQGSQYYQMGRQLYQEEPVFRSRMDQLDGLMRERFGYSVLEPLYHADRRKSDWFDDIEITHPAVFMVEHALAQALLAQGVKPDLVLGSSLGTFCAAVVAGCLTAEEALVAVATQARLLRAHCPPGVMMAVLDEPAKYEAQAREGGFEVAARNFRSHFVLSAPPAEAARMEALLREREVILQRLPVRFAFHAQWIDSLREPFLEHMSRLRFEPPRLPLVCCAQAGVLDALTPQHFWRIAREPILFDRTIAGLEAGLKAGQDAHTYVDVGPSGTLATFLKYLLPPGARSHAHAVLSPFGDDAGRFRKLLQALPR